MAGINLDARGQKLRDELVDLVSQYRAQLASGTRDWTKYRKLEEEMATKAHELHLLVKPKHHKYMIENRGVSPDTVEFYRHIHPVEDLLAFISDTTANDDPEDQTVGHEFDFSVYSRRWGHEDKYQIRRTTSGWYVGHISIGGDCDKSGHPFLFENLDHDFITYPNKLPYYMSSLWDSAAEQGLTHEEVQAALQQLADWISLCEKNAPDSDWKGQK